MKTNLMKRIAALSAAASVFAFSVTTAYAVDSPTATLTPQPNELVDSNGNTDTVLFVDENGETYITPEDVTLEVHDLSEAHNGELPEITQMLEGAQAAIDSVEYLDELTPEVDDVLAAYNAEHTDTPDIKIGDLVVADIFDVSLVQLKDGEDDHVIDSDNIPKNITATFELTFPFEVPDFYILLHEFKEGEWRTETDIERIDSDTLRITVDDFSPFALVVEKSDTGESSVADSSSQPSQSSKPAESTAAPVGKNPNTGTAVLGISIGIFAVLGAAVILTRNKDDKEK